MAQWLTSSQFKLAATKVNPEINYLTRPLPSTYDFPDHERSLVTVFNLSAEPHTLKDNLQKLCREFQARDDVFRPEFLQGVIVRGAASSEGSSSLEELWSDWGTKWQYFDNAEDTNNMIPSGPYVIQQGRLAQVWRLYDDHNKAFLTAVWPSPDDERYSCPYSDIPPFVNFLQHLYQCGQCWYLLFFPRYPCTFASVLQKIFATATCWSQSGDQGYFSFKRRQDFMLQPWLS